MLKYISYLNFPLFACLNLHACFKELVVFICPFLSRTDAAHKAHAITPQCACAALPVRMDVKHSDKH